MSESGRWITALVVSLAAIPASANAQTRVTGTVRRNGSGDAVVNARIEIVERRLRALSGDDGRFAFDAVPLGTHTLRVVRMGFAPAELELAVQDTSSVDLSIDMEPLALRLSEVVVTPGHFGVMETEVVAEQTLTRDEIETLPQFGEDIFRALKRLPGVAAHDISTKLNLRGATDQELLVLVDGLELYEPYHLKDLDGALGIIDVHSIGSIDLVTGGFSVEHGDKLTGVFDMTSRTPPVTGSRTTLGLSITNASIMSQGGFGAGSGQWLVAARRGYLDIALALTGGSDGLSPQYYDIFGKLQYQAHRKHLLSANVLHASDNFAFDEDELEFDAGWRSSYGWITWHADLNSHISGRTMTWAGRVTRHRLGDGEDPGYVDGPEKIFVTDDRVFRFAGASHDLNIELSERLMLKAGGEVKAVESSYDYFHATRTIIATPAFELGARHDTTSVSLVPQGHEAGAYLAARVRPIDAVTAEVGVRYDAISHTADTDWSPRVSAAIQLTPLTDLRGSWGRYHQSHGVHELQVGDGQRSFFPSDGATQVAVGLEQRLPGDVNLRLEVYHRAIRDQRPRFINTEQELWAFPEAEGPRLRIDPERGSARGIEMLVSRELGRHWAWSASYVLAIAEDEIEGEWVPRALDQRHTIGLNAAYRPNDKWRLSAAWYYHTGWPTTDTGFRVDTLTDGSLYLAREFGQLNAIRLPAYHRLDFRVTRNFSVGNGVLQAYFDIFNVYNRTNISSFDHWAYVDDQGDLFVGKDNGQELLPILPSIGFRYEF
jgi:outer membrane cobalamin receptor